MTQKLLHIDELRESWADMFEHIDFLIETIVQDYPAYGSLVNRDVILKAVKSTQKLDALLEQAKMQSNKDQEQLFDGD